MTQEYARIQVEIPAPLARAAREKAQREHIAIARLIREFIRRWVAGEIKLTMEG